ncbi:MAG: DinB family protein [Phaeodactylibacter sp.]|nr:DinB family protein [Phaeodactylibacter sp.]MCB9292239.1 DinB family protein [Lewinellaceae bacterium]
MNLAPQIAKQFREVYLNGTWVATTNLKAQLSDVTWEEATTKVGTLNTLAALAFHVNYYVSGVLNVLKGGSLDIRDKYSFDMPPVESQEDWEKLLDKMWSDGEAFASLVEQMPDEKLAAGFVDEKYGNYYRNILAMIEHSYYHLGQVVLIKKMIRQEGKTG